MAASERDRRLETWAPWFLSAAILVVWQFVCWAFAISDFIFTTGIVYHTRLPFLVRSLERICRRHLQNQVTDPEVREKLTPAYAFGCKRPSFSNSYLTSFNRDDVALVTDPIARQMVNFAYLIGDRATGECVVVDPAYEITQAIAHTLIVDDTRLKRRGRKVDQFAAEIRAFSDGILHGRPPETSGREGWWDVRIIEALYESAARGEHIALPRIDEPGPSSRQGAALPPVTAPPPLVKVEAPHE